jgi:hypothetical protein
MDSKMDSKPVKTSWHIGQPDRKWACGHLVNHLIDQMTKVYGGGVKHIVDPQCHISKEPSDVRFLTLVPQMRILGVDERTILHLDGNRWRGAGVGSPVCKRNKKISLFSLVFELNRWSWGHVENSLTAAVGPGVDVFAQDFVSFRRTGAATPGIDSSDMVLSQNVTQLRYLRPYLSKVIARCGGNMSFDGQPGKYVDQILEMMGQCAAVIATNHFLYQQAIKANPHTFLIPNGIDLSVWRPGPARTVNQWRIRKARIQGLLTRVHGPVVGFVGNVATHAKQVYKGFHISKDACRQLAFEFKEALYGARQIPHGEMMPRFYHQIDVLLHPTAGEGSSNTLMEALACGVPVVTTRTAGFHGEMMEHDVNVLFCERTVESIVEQLRRLKEEPGLAARIGAAGRKFAEEHHDIRVVADQYLYVFWDVLRRSGLRHDVPDTFEGFKKWLAGVE